MHVPQEIRFVQTDVYDEPDLASLLSVCFNRLALYWMQMLHMHVSLCVWVYMFVCQTTQQAQRDFIWSTLLLVEVPVWARKAEQDSYRVSACVDACMHATDRSRATVCLKHATETSIKHQLCALQPVTTHTRTHARTHTVAHPDTSSKTHTSILIFSH